MFIRLIQKDLVNIIFLKIKRSIYLFIQKINAGPKHIIDSLGSNAYESFQATNDLQTFIKRYLEHKNSVDNGTQLNKQLSIKIELMTPSKIYIIIQGKQLTRQRRNQSDSYLQ